MAFLPNSSCNATFTKQLTMITQNVMKPAFAPSAVVAMSSPEPTMAAERIKPGPRYLSLPTKVVGGESVLIIDLLFLKSEGMIRTTFNAIYLLLNPML